MMSATAKIAVPQTPDERRFATRINIRLEANLGDNSANTLSVILCNLSVTGCRFECASPIAVSSRLTIDIEGVPPIAGIAVWNDGAMVGCQFDAPIEVGICNGIIRKLRNM